MKQIILQEILIYVFIFGGFGTVMEVLKCRQQRIDKKSEIELEYYHLKESEFMLTPKDKRHS